jgi:D-alanine-D-alanine ligase
MINKDVKVAVLMGGISEEREISLISGNQVLQALLRSGINAYGFDTATNNLQQLKDDKVDIALLMTHGRGGEDGVLQGSLEQLGIPYTGSGVLASAIAMNKYFTSIIWKNFAIPMPNNQYVTAQNLKDFKLTLKLPVIVKPVCGGSTLGTTKVYELDQLMVAINTAMKYDNAVLIEQLICGDEFAITVCNGVVYPLIKIVAPLNNYDYQNKYFTDETKYICPYFLDNELQMQIERYAILGYNAIKARGIARLDLLLTNDKKIFFLEINTIPGMTNHSLVPMAYKAKNISYDELCLLMLNHAKLGD